jgi:hypothetical protein
VRSHRLATIAILQCIGCGAALPALADISIGDATVTEGQAALLTVSLDQSPRSGVTVEVVDDHAALRASIVPRVSDVVAPVVGSIFAQQSTRQITGPGIP